MPDVGAQQALEIDITRKVYRRADGATLEAVRDLRLSAGPREFVCLIGPSGCGKTTTLRILLGLDRSFEGQVRPGCDRRRVGVVFQEPRLLPWRTVEQNIRLAAPGARARSTASWPISASRSGERSIPANCRSAWRAERRLRAPWRSIP